MSDTPQRTDLAPRSESQWQEKGARRVALGVLALALAALIVGSLVDWWLPTTGRNVFATIFALFMTCALDAKHAYSRGVADAVAHLKRGVDDRTEA